MEKEYSKNNEIFIRSLETDTPDSRIVGGYAVQFETESEYIGYIEIIKRGAITEETIMNSDIFARFNHNEDTVLARSRYGEGTLALELNDEGLYYEFEAPHTAIGDELLEHLRRGEITSSSFAFTVPQDGSGEKWYKREDGTTVREILKIDKLFDVSPVWEPAYSTTTCSKRALEMVSKIDEIEKKYNAELKEIEKMRIF